MRASTGTANSASARTDLKGLYSLEHEDIHRLEEADYVRWEIPDLNGISKGKTMTRAALSSNSIGGISLYGGILGYGCNSDLVCMPGVGDSGHPDCFAVPRAAEPGVSGSLPAAAPVSWAGKGKAKVVSVICDTKWKHGGKDNWQGACPRVIARRQLQSLASMGFTLKSACEYEFRVFDEQQKPVMSGANICNTLVAAQYEEDLFCIEESMRCAGIDLETLQMEYGSSQFELTLAPQRGLDAADAAFRFKHCVKEIFQQKGQVASFMTKPLSDETANSCHFNLSLQPLVEEEATLFNSGSLQDEDREFRYQDGQLNNLARHFLGGIMKHAPALTALCAPTVNCYRRLHNPWAPSHGSWGLENRAMMVRLKTEGDGGCYFENRLGCGASNPYLVLAGTVAAGLDGLNNKLEPPPPDTTEECAELPKTLPESLDALEADEYMVNALGAEFLKWFQILKQAEIEAVKADNDTNRLAKEMQAYLRFL
mmetsp:Transcript_4373/g.12264  ORF Transcript_4373/g.12264 Transcript_4373/m.12264 type:complete len:483 (-) Transcript_4373:128-1576(-)